MAIPKALWWLLLATSLVVWTIDQSFSQNHSTTKKEIAEVLEVWDNVKKYKKERYEKVENRGKTISVNRANDPRLLEYKAIMRSYNNMIGFHEEMNAKWDWYFKDRTDYNNYWHDLHEKYPTDTIYEIFLWWGKENFVRNIYFEDGDHAPWYLTNIVKKPAFDIVYEPIFEMPIKSPTSLNVELYNTPGPVKINIPAITKFAIDKSKYTASWLKMYDKNTQSRENIPDGYVNYGEGKWRNEIIKDDIVETTSSPVEVAQSVN